MSKHLLWMLLAKVAHNQQQASLLDPYVCVCFTDTNCSCLMVDGWHRLHCKLCTLKLIEASGLASGFHSHAVYYDSKVHSYVLIDIMMVQ